MTAFKNLLSLKIQKQVVFKVSKVLTLQKKRPLLEVKLVLTTSNTLCGGGPQPSAVYCK